MKAHCDVLIQGAGIGGLTLAIALQQRGYKVKLVERADGLTLADTNLEGANMMALQTRQQLSITALSLASQANQAVLRLFG